MATIYFWPLALAGFGASNKVTLYIHRQLGERVQLIRRVERRADHLVKIGDPGTARAIGSIELAA